MTGFSSVFQSPAIRQYSRSLRPVQALCALLICIPTAAASEVYSFQDDRQLSQGMQELAAQTVQDLVIPDPCHMHIVTVAGGRELFLGNTFDVMHRSLAAALLGKERLATCELNIHELSRDTADSLYKRIKRQGSKALILEATYIPLTDTVAAFTKLHTGQGHLLGESGRFDLPVTRGQFAANIEHTAAIKPAAPELPVPKEAAPRPAVAKPAPEKPAPPKLTNKLLAEVHFDPSSADVTVVGARKVKQAIEAIKKQNPKQVRILGFTDTKGPAAANKAMAGARAKSVARLLKDAGVGVPLIVEGRGEEGGPHKIPDGVSEPLNRCVGIIAEGVPAGK